ncbi:MAG: ROK family protein [Desulfuromonadaceae bacterium]|nr:ROK family protein [Desulfuromonadaceae bacterium]MDD2849521.1 ROK family protein [Desulfuromonadaceae bacterium]MDD4131947.1 ROK family protein [Desulfuromonadaceae bacterium]
MQTNECVIGIDIGGTTTSLGFVNRQGALTCEATLDTLANQPGETLVSRLYDTIEKQRSTLPPQTILSGIGIGAPNANYLRGTVENPVNLNWGALTNLVELFRGRFDLPVAITNDANAAAIGELLFGGARGMKHVIVITLGTGLGSGIIVNGELLYGSDGFAGELGHTTVDPDGRVCACGKRGCLETYVSATGLCRTVSELLAKRLDRSTLREVSFSQFTSKQIFEAAGGGDSIALAAFVTTGRILGMKLADAVAHTSPEAIFLSGGLASAGELLLAPTRRYLEEFLFTPYKGKVKLLRSELPEGSGAVLGAAALAWHEVGIATPP